MTTKNILAKSVLENGYAVGHLKDSSLNLLLPSFEQVPCEMLSGILSSNPELTEIKEQLQPLLSYYYNEDNEALVSYSFATPKGEKVSVGAMYIAYNHTDLTTEVATIGKNSIRLGKDEYLMLNLGQIGLEYTLKETSLLQIVIHSSLDSIGFASGSPLKQECLHQHSSGNEVYELPLNINEFLTQGVAVNRVVPVVANELLQLVKREHFVSVTQNELDACCEYSDRFISKHSMFKPQAIKSQYADLVTATTEVSAPVLKNKPNPAGDNLSVFMASTGHFMDLHSDCSDGSPIITIIYLSDDEFVESDGGQVSVSTMGFVEEGSLGRLEMRLKAEPKHGLAVHLNNSTPQFHHEVHKILSSKYRYSIIINSAMLTNPIWDVDFDEEVGRVDTETLTLDDPSSLN